MEAANRKRPVCLATVFNRLLDRPGFIWLSFETVIDVLDR